MPFRAAQHQWGVATASLGMSPAHTLESKFRALRKAGFQTTELSFGEYMAWVRQQEPQLPPTTCPVEWCESDEPDPSDDLLWEAMCRLAPRMIEYATTFGLRILMLQPLNQFDGWAVGHPRAGWVRRKAERWLVLCSALEVDYLQVGSNDKGEATAPDEKTADDLRWLAETGASQTHPVKVAYESWCFSKRVNTWEHTWKLVQMADHPNLGLCLDVAHPPLAPPPPHSYGWDTLTGAGWSEEDFSAMIKRMETIPAEKIFYIELSQVLDPKPPLASGSPFDEFYNHPTTSDMRAKGESLVWAYCARPVPLVGRNAGLDYRPEDQLSGDRVVVQLKALLGTGFKGPIVFEMFEATIMSQDSASIPDRYASACAKSIQMLEKAVNA